MKKYILAGNLPYLAAAILCAASFFMGQTTVEQPGKFAIAEKGAVVLQAVLDRPSVPPETYAREIVQPIIKVLKHYADQGFVVVDSTKDEQGNYSLIALPKNAIDITDELRAAIKAAQPAQDSKENPKAQANEKI